MDWFLYDNSLHHERVNGLLLFPLEEPRDFNRFMGKEKTRGRKAGNKAVYRLI